MYTGPGRLPHLPRIPCSTTDATRSMEPYLTTVRHPSTPGWTCVLIIGWYTLLRFFGKVSMALYIMQFQIVLNGMIIVLTEFKSAGDVHDGSVNLLKTWVNSVGKDKKTMKLSKRRLRSCWPLKVKIGPINYFETGTPAEIGSFCVEQVINLILAEWKQSQEYQK